MEFGRLIVYADSNCFDKGVSTNIWFDPATGQAMLTPLCFTSAWRTTFTGNYARFAKADLTFATPAAWKQYNRVDSPFDYWLTANGVSEGARTTASMAVNQPMLVSAFIPFMENLTDEIIFSFGYGAFGDAGSVWFRITAGGKVGVYKGGILQNLYEPKGGAGTDAAREISQGGKAKSGKTVTWVVIPSRDREIIFVDTDGDSFCHAFADLAPWTPGQTITPNAPFYLRQEIGAPAFQLARVKFATAGALYGPVVPLRYPPQVGASTIFIPGVSLAGPASGATTVVYDLATPGGGVFTPDGVSTEARVKAVLGGDGTSSYALVGVDGYIPRTVAYTDDSEAMDITCRLSDIRLQVNRQGIATADLGGFNPQSMYDAGLANPTALGHRPIRIAIGDVDIFRGTTDKPVWEQGNDKAGGDTSIKWRCQDRTRQFANSRFVDTLPYDGLYLTEAVEMLLVECGFDPSELDISPDSFIIPYNPGLGANLWQYIQRRGETRGQWLDRLHREFAANWIRGWIPTLTGQMYRFRNPATLSATPALELWWSWDDIPAAGLDWPNVDIAQRVIRRGVFTEREMEANQVIVIGQDPRTKNLIYAQADDFGSQNITTPPSLRPTNWVGDILNVTYEEPQLTTQAAVNRARDIYAARLMVDGQDLQFDCEALVRFTDGRPLWVTDVVRVYRPDAPTVPLGDYRIVEIPEIKIEKEISGVPAVRSATYVGELI